MLHKYDIVWLRMEPHSGIEEGSHDIHHLFRPVIVCSNQYYNQIGMIIGMPITSHQGLGPLNQDLIKIKTNLNRIHGYAIPFKIGGYDYHSCQAKKVDSLKVTYQYKINEVLRDALADE